MGRGRFHDSVNANVGMIPMNENVPLEEIQHVIGYEFQDPKIFEAALTRRAFRHENPADNENFMEPLATLGDAILAAVVVYKSYKDGNRQKGSLTEEKIRFGNRDYIRSFSEKHQLQKYVHWGKGEEQNKIWDEGDKALDTVFEALIGGVFLDSQRKGKNGMTEVEKMLDRLEFFKSTAK